MIGRAGRSGDALRQRVRIDVRGAVQGVGFRPFAWREATALGLAGFVANTPKGVTIEAEGSPATIAELLDVIENEPPPNASILDLAVEKIWTRGDVEFEIRDSVLDGVTAAAILPDLASCEECLAEMRDMADRRYRYPFINCTQCGPRFTIIEGLPYDRARTSMRRFAMCEDCRAEYHDPADRRFHAEPNACPRCGPQLALWDGAGRSAPPATTGSSPPSMGSGAAPSRRAGSHIRQAGDDGAACRRAWRFPRGFSMSH